MLTVVARVQGRSPINWLFQGDFMPCQAILPVFRNGHAGDCLLARGVICFSSRLGPVCRLGPFCGDAFDFDLDLSFVKAKRTQDLLRGRHIAFSPAAEKSQALRAVILPTEKR